MAKSKSNSAGKTGKSSAPPESAVSDPTPTRSRWNLTHAAVAVVFLGALLLCLRKDPSSASPALPSVATANDEATRATAALQELNALRAEHLRLMRAVGDGDSEAEAVIRFHEEHARYAYLTVARELEFPAMNPEERARELNSPDPFRYFVVELDRDERIRRGVMTNAYMAFDHTTKVMYVDRGASFQAQLAGAIILHEVQHAYDRLHGREAVWATEVDRAPGERRAYRLETRVLRRQLAGALDAFIGRMLEARGPQSACVLPGDITPSEREAYRGFFPGIGSGNAPDYRMAIFDLAIMVNFERASRARLGEAYELACILLAQRYPQL